MSANKIMTMRDALLSAQRLIERDFPNGQLAIDIRNALTSTETHAETIQKIVEMSNSVDGDPAIPAGDSQWRKGYKQACSDIILALSRPHGGGK